MRLIDADKAIALAKDIAVETKSGSIYRHRCIDPSCIEELPPVDAVPVVRCKDCKYFVESDPSHPDCDYCKRMCWFGIIGKNDYCSKGERKESDNG